MAYCSFKWTQVGTQKWWSELFIHTFTIIFIKRELIYQESYTETLNSILKILLLWRYVQKVVTTSFWSLYRSHWRCTMPFLVNPSKNNNFHWPAVEKVVRNCSIFSGWRVWPLDGYNRTWCNLFAALIYCFSHPWHSYKYQTTAASYWRIWIS